MNLASSYMPAQFYNCLYIKSQYRVIIVIFMTMHDSEVCMIYSLVIVHVHYVVYYAYTANQQWHQGLGNLAWYIHVTVYLQGGM